MRTRAEHLEWCKDRAQEYLLEGDVVNAITSMLSDIQKHPETKLKNGHVLFQLGMMIISEGDIRRAAGFIEGFN